MRRDDVASTLIRRHFGTKCPLGMNSFFFSELQIFLYRQNNTDLPGYGPMHNQALYVLLCLNVNQFNVSAEYNTKL